MSDGWMLDGGWMGGWWMNMWVDGWWMMDDGRMDGGWMDVGWVDSGSHCSTRWMNPLSIWEISVSRCGPGAPPSGLCEAPVRLLGPVNTHVLLHVPLLEVHRCSCSVLALHPSTSSSWSLLRLCHMT